MAKEKVAYRHRIAEINFDAAIFRENADEVKLLTRANPKAANAP